MEKVLQIISSSMYYVTLNLNIVFKRNYYNIPYHFYRSQSKQKCESSVKRISR